MKQSTITIAGRDIPMQYKPQSVSKTLSPVHSQSIGIGNKTTFFGSESSMTASIDFYRSAEIPQAGGISANDLIAGAVISGLNAVAGEFVQTAKKVIGVAKGIYDQASGFVGAISGSKDEKAKDRLDDYNTMIEDIRAFEHAAAQGIVITTDIDALQIDSDTSPDFVITNITSSIEAMDSESRTIMMKVSVDLLEVNRLRMTRIAS